MTWQLEDKLFGNPAVSPGERAPFALEKWLREDFQAYPAGDTADLRTLPAWFGLTLTLEDDIEDLNASKIALNVWDYGAMGGGIVDDTAAIVLAEAARSAIGATLIFPAKTYKHSGITIDRELGGGWIGMPGARFIPTANSVVLMDLTNAIISSANWRDFCIEGFFFDGDGKTGVYGIREVSPYHTTITKCGFSRLSVCVHMTGSPSGPQTGWVNISDIQQNGQGSWFFSGADDTHYIFAISITNFNQQGTGAANWEQDFGLLLRRACIIKIANFNFGSLDGDAVGIEMLGDCQGVSLANVGIEWPTTGIRAGPWTDGVLPGYVSMANVDVDQPEEIGMDIKGRFWRMVNVPVTNGRTRSSTGPGVLIQSESHDIDMINFYVAYMNHTGITVEAGATDIRMSGITAVNNNDIAGANYEIDLGACSFKDVVLTGKNKIGAAGVNATGQRVVNGVTSDMVYLNTGSVATTAVITAEDLMSYTIPASALKPGMRVRIRAWGTTAANGNSKTFRLFFGSANLGGQVTSTSGAGWELDATVVVTGSNTQEYSRIGYASTVVSLGTGTPTETDTNAIIVKMQGQNGVASSGDITCQGFSVEIKS